MAGPELHIERDKAKIRIEGALDLYHFEQAKRQLSRSKDGDNTSIDLSGLTRLDTAGAMLLKNTGAKLEHIKPEHRALFDMLADVKPGKTRLREHVASWVRAVRRLGQATLELVPASREFITFTGHACIELWQLVKQPKRLRWNSITHQIEVIGIDAVPIISLIAFTISVVIAYQGQVQLQRLGAQQYTVNMVAISVLREMGVLLTAIMVAGRSGSAFTAEIGAMKVREEIDALRSMGFNIFELLVLPRLLALLVVLPLLALLADVVGLLGGALISMSLIDISMPEYWERARQAASWKDFLVGLIKAPVFAFVIALVGCMHGLKVSGSAESVGKETTASVVKSIFLVLMIDGLFSVYFQKVGL